jgi:peptide/nickel transport system substrate-binding protein
MRSARATAAVVACCLALASGGCQRHAPGGVDHRPGAAASGPRDGGTLRVQMEVEPPTLNPLVEHDAWTVWLTLGAIHEPLVRQDPSTGAFQPALAASWQEEGATRYRFRLRAGVHFHDGSPLTADDVVATFARLREPGVAAERREEFADLTAVDKIGPDAVELRFGRPAPLALQAIAHLPILRAHAFSEGGDLRAQPESRAPVGTGPFRFVEWRAGERIVLARNDGYWGRRAHLDRVELRVVRDRDAALELLRRGELDLLWQVPPAQLDRLPAAAAPSPSPSGAGQSADPLASMHREAWYLPRYSFVVWNTRHGPLGDRRVRQALALLTDRARYLATALHGRGKPVTGPYVPGSPGYDARIAPWPFDQARARALLDEAGVVDRDGDGVREAGGQPLRLAFLLQAGSPTVEPLATMMQEDFRRAGVALDLVPVDWATLLDRLRKHAFDAAALSWVLQPVQDNRPLFHSSQASGGQNYGGFRDPDVDALLDEIRGMPPGAARAELERRLHRLLHEAQPYTFLVAPEIDSLVAPRVHGYAPGPDGLGFAGMWIDP